MAAHVTAASVHGFLNYKIIFILFCFVLIFSDIDACAFITFMILNFAIYGNTDSFNGILFHACSINCDLYTSIF